MYVRWVLYGLHASLWDNLSKQSKCVYPRPILRTYNKADTNSFPRHRSTTRLTPFSLHATSTTQITPHSSSRVARHHRINKLISDVFPSPHRRPPTSYACLLLFFSAPHGQVCAFDTTAPVSALASLAFVLMMSNLLEMDLH